MTNDLQSLRSTFRGPLLQPEDAGYDDARKIWNGSIDNAKAHLLSALDIESEEVIHTAFGPNLPRLVEINVRPDLARAGAA